MDRKKKFLLNSSSGFIKQIVTLVCGFVLTKAILMYYGSEINGLVSSITQFLGFITFLEMGIGPVIQSNLYKPLANSDSDKINQIVKSSNTFFKRIAYIFILYILILCILFPRLKNSNYSFWFTASLVLIISVSTLAQYYFGMTYQLLLNADQKGYIPLTVHWITLLLNTIVAVILMVCGCSIHVVKIATAAIYVFRPLIINTYARKKYHIDDNVSYEIDPIKQKWNGFAQHLSSVVCDNTDVVVLTIMSTLKNVSIYTVYYSVAYGLTQVVMTTVNGLEAMWGNMLATNEWDTLESSFSFTEWFIHTVVTIIFTIASILILPFVMVYTSGINDANYYQPVFGAFLVIAFAMQCYRVPYFRLIKAAGHYKETQNGAFICASINIIISVIFVKFYGLIGVTIGTFIALLYHTCYFAVYLKKHILNRSIKHFIIHMVVNSLIIVIAYCVSYFTLELDVSGYIEWVILALRVCLIVLAISFVINLLFFRGETCKAFMRLKNIRIKKSRR